nr:unnamed protein product [Digitaria exilis]
MQFIPSPPSSWSGLSGHEMSRRMFYQRAENLASGSWHTVHWAEGFFSGGTKVIDELPDHDFRKATCP